VQAVVVLTAQQAQLILAVAAVAAVEMLLMVGQAVQAL